MQRGGDSTTRFLEYILSFPNTYSYISKFTAPFARRNECFHYDCSSMNAFKQIMANTILGTKASYDIPYDIKTRKLYPPLWSKQVNRKFGELLENPTQPYLVIPLLLHKKLNCNEQRNRIHEDRHLSIILFNTHTRELEHVDDLFVEVQRDYGHRFLAEKYIHRFLVRFLNTWIGDDDFAKNPSVSVPTLNAHELLPICKALGIDPPNFYMAHKIFLTTYLQNRLSQPDQTADECRQETLEYLLNDPNAARKYYQKYIRFNDKYLKKHEAILKCKDGQMRNLETRRCNEDKNSSESDLSIDMPLHFPEKQLTEDEIVKRLAGYAGMFFTLKYDDLACLMPDGRVKSYSEFTFEWKWNPEIEKHEMYYPEEFPEFWQDAMMDPSKRFIMMFVFLHAHVPEEALMENPNAADDLSGRHLNALLYDKKTNILERYEPNGKGAMEFYDNAKSLDDDLMTIEEFANVRFMSSQSYCPLGVHKLEWTEGKTYTTKRGGNCGLWVIWSMELRLNNPDVPHEKLYSKAHKKILNMGSFKIFANGYQAYLNKMFQLDFEARSESTSSSSSVSSSASSKKLQKQLSDVQKMVRTSPTLQVPRLTKSV